VIQKLTLVIGMALMVGAACTGSALGADPADSLIGHWKLDGDTQDASGRENHGATAGDPVFEAGQSSAFKQAMYFDGNGDYLVIDPVADDFTNDDLTLSAWIKTDDMGAWQWWFSNNTAGGGNVIILGLVNGNIVVHQGAVVVTSSTVVNDLEWRHVAYSRIGSVGSLYIDGVLEGTHTANFTLGADNLWSIGQEWDGASPGDFLNGTVDDVRIYDAGLTEEQLPEIMTLQPGVASEPSPADGATDVLRDTVLSWTPGDFAPAVNGHTVTFSENFDDVNDGAGGVTQSDNTFAPGRLAFGTTYYWRVDEVNGAPDFTVHTGDVWSFTVEPEGYPIAGVQVTTNGLSEDGKGPENTINGSGLNADDEHGTDSAEMWMAFPADDGSLWIEYAFDRVYKLHQMLVWNCNVQYEPLLGFGMQTVAIEYSADGVDWTSLGDVDLAQATGQVDYTSNTTIDFDGAAVRYVRLTLNSAFGAQGQYGLSEVRFLSIPVYATEPDPADGATDVSVSSALSWKAGRDVASHDVHLGAETEDLSLVASLAESVYETSDLDLGTTYAWQVVEVNEPEAWASNVWTFSTRGCVVIDDFESYDDDENRIYSTWVDGYQINDNGSQVGNLESPFAEMTIVRSGGQSMPIFYDTAGASYAEAERTFATPQNWTRHGIETLTLFFRGQAGNTGQLYARINGVKTLYDGSADAISKITWQTWNIDLAGLGIDLTNVRTLVIGVEGAGASGTLFVDDVHLYRVAPLAPIEPDNTRLVARYALEGDATDGSGNGFDGEILGDATFEAGMVGQAIALDGGDDFVRIADDERLHPGDGSFSFTFWAQLDPASSMSGNASWDIAIGKRQTGSNGYYIGANRAQGGSNEAGFKFMLGNTSGSRVDTPYMTVPLGEWVFVSAVLDRDANTHKISVNGGSTWATATPPVGSIAPAQDLGFGFDIGPDNYWFHGLLDEVRLYDTALTDAEVAWLANDL